MKIFFLIFLLFYGPKIGYLDFLSLGAIFALLSYPRYLKRALNTWPMFWAIVLTLYIAFVLLFNGVVDTWWLLRTPRYIVNSAACFVIVYYLCANGRRDDLFYYIFLAAIVHAGIVVLQANSSVFSSFLIDLLGNQQRSEIRFSGLVFGLSPAAYVMSSSIFLGYYSLLSGRISALTFWGGAIIIFTACLVMGRTGFYLGFTSSLLLIMYDQISKGHIIRVVLAVFSLVLPLILVVLLVDVIFTDPIANAGVRHGLEPIFHFLKFGYLYSASLDDFGRDPFIYHNVTILEYMFGTGLFGRGDPFTYLETDIAYAHMFSAFGLVGVSLFILGTLSMVVFNSHTWKHHRLLFLAFCLMILVVFIMNYKQTIIMTRHIASLLAFTWAFLSFARNEGRRLQSYVSYSNDDSGK